MSSSNRAGGKKPQRRFQFIDNSNIGSSGTNSTQVRRHVMQEYMREKRWESRTKAEDDVLSSTTPAQPQSQLQSQPQPQQSQIPSQHQLHHPVATSPQRRLPPKSRTKGRSSSTAPHVGNAPGFSAPIGQPPLLGPSAYNFQPPVQTPRIPPQAKGDGIEEIPRQFAPASQLEPKRKRQPFYLTPQSFATIADLSDLSPPTPASTIISGDSLSPAPSSSSSSSSSSGQYFGRANSLSPEPFSLLSASRTDPFNSLPLALNQQDRELFDFYATVMPACSYGFERRSPRAHNWYLSVFIPEAMKSPVAFQNTILVHAANTQAWVRGLSETPLAMEHRTRANEMLLEHFKKYPLDTSDAAISSTLSAAALEDFDPRLERRKYAWLHWNAAMRKIRDRGGPAALEQNKSLRMLINWSDYIFSGYNGQGSTFFFDYRFSPKKADSTNHIEAEAIGRNELAQQCEDFVIFLKCAESLAVVASNMKGSLSTNKGQPIRYSVFEDNQPLYRLLASPNGRRYTETGQLKQIVSRLAALMTINVAIWEYRYSTTATESFFCELVENIKYNNLDQHPSVEALLQILLSGSDKPELVHTERPWLVGRLLKVAKRLSRNSWEQLNDFLLQCLTLEPPLKPTMETWEHALRAEILAAPLVSYVLPLMQTA